MKDDQSIACLCPGEQGMIEDISNGFYPSRLKNEGRD